MRSHARIMISILFICATMALVSCSSENYRAPLTQSIKEIERAINENDLSRFSSQAASTDLNKHFKIFSIFASLFDKSDPKSKVIIFTPVEFKNSFFGGVKANMSVEYKGTINVLRIQAVSDVLKKVIQIGMPDKVTFKYKNRVGGGVTPADLPHHRTYGSRIRRFLPPVAGSSLRSADYSPVGL